MDGKLNSSGGINLSNAQSVTVSWTGSKWLYAAAADLNLPAFRDLTGPLPLKKTLKSANFLAPALLYGRPRNNRPARAGSLGPWDKENQSHE
jgi:hypothetical protein